MANNFAETRNMFPLDLELRRRGFKVHARPRDGPAVWSRGNETYTFEQALERAGIDPCTGKALPAIVPADE